MSAATGWWRCAECGQLTADPHTGIDDEDLCLDCCELCTSGRTAAMQEWTMKNESRPLFDPGDPMPYHGLPSREQMAAAEAGRP